MPCPSGPVVVSTPEVQRYSGWPGGAASRAGGSDSMSSRLTAGSPSDLVVGVDRLHLGEVEQRVEQHRGVARPRARSGRGWARSGRRGRSAGSAARACRRPGASAIGVPGWPEFAFWIASIESVRIVLMQSWSMSLGHAWIDPIDSGQGSIRVTVPSPLLATQTASAPTATAPGFGADVDRVADRSPLSMSIRLTVSSAALATQTTLVPASIPPGPAADRDRVAEERPGSRGRPG